MGLKKLAIIANIVVLLALLAACGQSSNHDSSSRIPGQNAATTSLSQALAELDSLQAPEGIDAAVFTQLKNALRAALIARGLNKLTSTPPTGAANAVPDFTIADLGDGTADLAWHYYNLGDYNQDGTVGIADITPLAMHFGQGWVAGEENTLPCVVDGSGDGTVNIADVTPIAMNFGVEVYAYRIAYADIEDGIYALGDTAGLVAGVDEEIARMRFQVNLPIAPLLWYRVVPIDAAAAQGIPSNSMQAPAIGAPTASIVPDVTTGNAPLTVNFDASGSTDPDGTIVQYEWDWGGDGVYDFNSGGTPTASIVYPVEGSFQATVRVTDDDGLQDTATVTIQVNPALLPPVADIVPALIYGEAPLADNFSAEFSSDSDGTITRYEWDWEGDGIYDLDTGAVASASHDYTIIGTYHPTVRVTDNDGLQDTASTTVRAGFNTWTHTWGGAGVEGFYDFILQPSGKVLVLGSTNSSGAGMKDVLLGMYLSDGSLSWMGTMGGTSDDEALDFARGISGEFYIAGTTSSFGAGGDDQFLLRVNDAGVVAWSGVWGGAGDESADGIAIDSVGDVYIAGSSLSTSLDSDGTLIKSSPTGGITWARCYDSGGGDMLCSIAIDSADDLYVVGASTGFGVGDPDVVLLKVDSDGNLIWERRWAGADTEVPYDIAVDNAGNSYIAGYTESSGAGSRDAFLIKFTSTGDLEWQETWGGPDIDLAYGITVADSEHIYVSGFCSGFSAVGTQDAFALNLDSDGNLRWAYIYDSADACGATSIFTGSDGGVYVAGVAPDNTGTWASITGYYFESSPEAADTVSGSFTEPTLTLGAAVGTELAAVGVIDTGGGSADTLLTKVDPWDWTT